MFTAAGSEGGPGDLRYHFRMEPESKDEAIRREEAAAAYYLEDTTPEEAIRHYESLSPEARKVVEQQSTLVTAAFMSRVIEGQQDRLEGSSVLGLGQGRMDLAVYRISGKQMLLSGLMTFLVFLPLQLGIVAFCLWFVYAFLSRFKLSVEAIGPAMFCMFPVAIALYFLQRAGLSVRSVVRDFQRLG